VSAIVSRYGTSEAYQGVRVFKANGVTSGLPGESLRAQRHMRLIRIYVDKDGEGVSKHLSHLFEVRKIATRLILCGAQFQLHCDKISLIPTFCLAAFKRNMHDDIRANVESVQRYPLLIFLFDNGVARQFGILESVS